MDPISRAVQVLAEADPAEVAAAMAYTAGMDPDRATRAEVALRLLAADDRDVPFWSVLMGGHA